MKAAIFVDGENFRRSLVELFGDDFPKEQYLPKKADWEGFFDFLTQKAGCEERIRTYWYVIENVAFYPYKFPDREEKLFKLYSEKQSPYKDELEKLKMSSDENELTHRLQKITSELKNKREYFKKRFEGWREIQDGIAKKHFAIEFRRAGTIRYNLFNGTLGPEKAVDVKMAVDLLQLRNIYDTAIIVSGDQDFVPAVKVIKDSGKRVINVCFLTRDGRYLPGGAKRLNQETDTALEIRYEEIKKFILPEGEKK